MKKLIFAAAAVAGMGAFALESANVVGYSTTDYTTTGFKAYVGQFGGTGKQDAEMTLGDIKPNAVFEWGSDELQLLTTQGATDSVYYYAAPELAAENEMEAGWWLVDFGEPVEVANSLPIAAGEGFLLNCASSGVELNMPQVLAAE